MIGNFFLSSLAFLFVLWHHIFRDVSLLCNHSTKRQFCLAFSIVFCIYRFIKCRYWIVQKAANSRADSKCYFLIDFTWRRSWSTGATGVANGWKSRGGWTLGTAFIWCHHSISIAWLIDFCWWHWQWRSQMVFAPGPNWKWEVDMIIRTFLIDPSNYNRY